MSRHNTIRASLAVTAAALAIGATSAGAMPTRDGTPPLKASQTTALDAAHASLAHEHSATLAAQQPQITTRTDLRSPDTRDAAIAAATQPVLQGPPAFSTTNVAALHSAQPLARDDGNDVPLLGIILGLTGAGILGAGGAFAATRTSRSRRARVA